MLGMLRRMVDAKQLSVLIITHKFREVTAYCDEVTVLRKGKSDGSRQSQRSHYLGHGNDDDWRTSLGKTIEKRVQEFGLPLLQIKGLEANRDNGVRAFVGLDLSVRAGEIVGVAGVSGNGQRELG